MRQFLTRLNSSGLLRPLAKIALALVALVAFMYGITWIGNPFLDQVPDPKQAAPSWMPSQPPAPLTAAPEPPPGFPAMEFPPEMVPVPAGQLQPVPTKFGFTYSVPTGNRWRPSNSTIAGWSDRNGTIATYGAVSDYGYGYCRDTEGSSLARVGVTGRNGVTPGAAAHDEIVKAERIFADAAGKKPSVEIRGPAPFDVEGRPAVRYTAVVTDIPTEHSCDPNQARFDIIAVPGYATAEVMLLMIEHHVGLPDALRDSDIDTVVASLRKTG